MGIIKVQSINQKVGACYPVQLQRKLLVPGLVTAGSPAGLAHHRVVQLQHRTDLIWEDGRNTYKGAGVMARE